MSKNHVFFSYSRDNTEFVLELAKKLRKAGADVWLDQLDIKTGERWDRSIEKALASSDVLMVVLSKASVASNNVMDEVSYALEEGKRVLPILLEDCDVPFRLRRLQFADFSTDPDDGMKVLISALELDGSKVEPLSSDSKLVQAVEDTSKAAAAMAATKPTSQEPVHSDAASARTTKSKKPMIYAVVALVAVLAVWGIYTVTSGGGKDMMALCKADWEEMETSLNDNKEVNELAALRKHIELYAPCPHENEAMDRISFLKAMGSDTEMAAIENNELTEDESAATNTEPPVKTIEPPVSKTETSNAGNTTDETVVEEKKKPVEVIEEVVKNDVLTGMNVVRVDFDTGHFKQVAGKSWTEINNGNPRQFKLLKRDKDAIYLGDGPDVRLTLNISESKIYYSDANSAPFHLYTIISKE